MSDKDKSPLLETIIDILHDNAGELNKDELVAEVQARANKEDRYVKAVLTRQCNMPNGVMHVNGNGNICLGPFIPLEDDHAEYVAEPVITTHKKIARALPPTTQSSDLPIPKKPKVNHCLLNIVPHPKVVSDEVSINKHATLPFSDLQCFPSRCCLLCGEPAHVKKDIVCAGCGYLMHEACLDGSCTTQGQVFCCASCQLPFQDEPSISAPSAQVYQSEYDDATFRRYMKKEGLQILCFETVTDPQQTCNFSRDTHFYCIEGSCKLTIGFQGVNIKRGHIFTVRANQAFDLDASEEYQKARLLVAVSSTFDLSLTLNDIHLYQTALNQARTHFASLRHAGAAQNIPEGPVAVQLKRMHQQLESLQKVVSARDEGANRKAREHVGSPYREEAQKVLREYVAKGAVTPVPSGPDIDEVERRAALLEHTVVALSTENEIAQADMAKVRGEYDTIKTKMRILQAELKESQLSLCAARKKCAEVTRQTSSSEKRETDMAERLMQSEAKVHMLQAQLNDARGKSEVERQKNQELNRRLTQRDRYVHKERIPHKERDPKEQRDQMERSTLPKDQLERSVMPKEQRDHVEWSLMPKEQRDHSERGIAPKEQRDQTERNVTPKEQRDQKERLGAQRERDHKLRIPVKKERDLTERHVPKEREQKGNDLKERDQLRESRPVDKTREYAERIAHRDRDIKPTTRPGESRIPLYQGGGLAEARL